MILDSNNNSNFNTIENSNRNIISPKRNLNVNNSSRLPIINNPFLYQYKRRKSPLRFQSHFSKNNYNNSNPSLNFNNMNISDIYYNNLSYLKYNGKNTNIKNDNSSQDSKSNSNYYFKNVSDINNLNFENNKENKNIINEEIENNNSLNNNEINDNDINNNNSNNENNMISHSHHNITEINNRNENYHSIENLQKKEIKIKRQYSSLKKNQNTINSNKSEIETQKNSLSENKTINLDINIHSKQELEKIKSLENEYKRKIDRYKFQSENFKTIQHQLQKKLNFTNEIINELKENLSSIVRFSSQNLISIINKLNEYPKKYILITKEMNKEILEKGKFTFNENLPIKSFNEGINFYEKMNEIKKEGVIKLKSLINDIEELQRKIILDNAFPISEEKKKKIFNLMINLNYNEIGKENFFNVVKEKNCIVCLEDFKKNETVKLFSCNKHIFHENCIKQWMETSDQCPLCKFSLKNDLIKFYMINWGE